MNNPAEISSNRWFWLGALMIFSVLILLTLPLVTELSYIGEAQFKPLLIANGAVFLRICVGLLFNHPKWKAWLYSGMPLVLALLTEGITLLVEAMV